MSWDEFSNSDWIILAKEWFRELELDSESETDIGESIVMMNFLASAEQQWAFIVAALSQADSDNELSHIAAGPLEHYLSSHGEDYFQTIENEFRNNEKFKRALTGVWQHLMSDNLWAKIKMLQKEVKEPLDNE